MSRAFRDTCPCSILRTRTNPVRQGPRPTSTVCVRHMLPSDARATQPSCPGLLPWVEIDCTHPNISKLLVEGDRYPASTTGAKLYHRIGIMVHDARKSQMSGEGREESTQFSFWFYCIKLNNSILLHSDWSENRVHCRHWKIHWFWMRGGAFG